MQRTLYLLYGTTCYVAFVAAFAYLIGFAGDFLVPKSVNDGPRGPLMSSLLVDLGLIALFGLQHSLMARPGFKAWWTRIVPRPLERSTFVLFSSAVLALLFLAWQPMPQVLWSVSSLAGLLLSWSVFWAGVGLVLLSSFLINHFELFGLQQVVRHYLERHHSPPAFRITLLYRIVRHPLYLGFLLFLWGGPEMTLGRFVLALGMSAYVLVGVHFEERDLIREHGQRYLRYRRQVPMLLPRPGRSTAAVRAELSVD